jgi:hypothetical protein
MPAAFGGDVMRRQHEGGAEVPCATQLPYSSHNAAIMQPNDGQIHFNIDRCPTNVYPEMATYQQMSTDAAMVKFDQTFDFPATSTVSDGRVIPIQNTASPRPSRMPPAPLPFSSVNWFDPSEHHAPHSHPVHPCGSGVMSPSDYDFPSPRELIAVGHCADRRLPQQQGPLNLNLNAVYDEVDDVKPTLIADDQVSQAMSATRNGYSGISGIFPCMRNSFCKCALLQQISYSRSRTQSRTILQTMQSYLLHRYIRFFDIQDF